MYILNVLKKNLKIEKSPEKNHCPGENLAIGALVIPKKLKKRKIQKNRKIEKSAIDENLVNRRHGSKKKRFLPRR